MNSRRMKILAGLSLAAGDVSTVCAAAQPSSPWSVAVYAGDAVSGTGSLRSPRTVAIPNLGTVDPRLAGASGTLTVDKLRYHQLFRNRFSAGAELGYAFDTHLQFFGRFTYDARKGRTRDIGTLSSPSLPAPQRLVGEFGDSDSRALEAGARYSWLASEAWRPYVALALGSTRTDEIRASLIVPNTAINLKDVRFARSGNSFSQSVETGVEYAPSPRFGLRFSVGATHAGTPPSARDPALTQLGFDAGNDAKSRFDFPVQLAGVYRFD